MAIRVGLKPERPVLFDQPDPSVVFMKRILLLSDTHGFIDESILEHASKADQIWHAGDIGTTDVIDLLAKTKPIRAVHGNIDSHELRQICPEVLVFYCEEVKVLMIHIAGSFGKYTPQTKALLDEHKPHVLVCGHSHILMVKRDNLRGHLHLNPGASGKSGFHTVRTLLRFFVDGSTLREMDVIELGPRSGSTKTIG